MNTRKTILPIGIVVCLIGGSVIIVNGLSKSSVKGVSTTISPRPTITPSPTLFPTLTPTPTYKPLLTKMKLTSQAKQYGGWYWQAGLNKSQVWIGTDSAGKDIWIDGLPTSTFTPTPEHAKSTQRGLEISSSSKASMTQELKTKVSAPKY